MSKENKNNLYAVVNDVSGLNGDPFTLDSLFEEV